MERKQVVDLIGERIKTYQDVEKSIKNNPKQNLIINSKIQELIRLREAINKL